MMRKTLFLAAALSLAFAANAQQRGPGGKPDPEQQAARTVERLDKELRLTGKQQADLKTWYTASFRRREEHMRKYRENREALRGQMKKDREADDARLKEVLTAGQYRTYKASEEKRMKEWRRRGLSGKGRPQRP